RSTLFPYTTLFRSRRVSASGAAMSRNGCTTTQTSDELREGLRAQMHPKGWGFRGLEGNMSTVYRIEIDIRIDNRTRTKVIQTAREDYRKSPFAWTFVDGEPVEISAEEFVVDTKTAFLELAESAFRSALP